MCHKLFMVCSILGCVLFIPGGALFIPRGCLIHPHPALIIPRVGLNWSPGMNRSLYLNQFYRLFVTLDPINPINPIIRLIGKTDSEPYA